MPNEQSIIEEAGLPENWQPIDSQPIIPGHPVGAAPVPNPQSNYLQGTIAPNFQHDSTFVGTEYGSPAVASTPLMPMGANANPITNAQIQSTASKVTSEALAGITFPKVGGNISTSQMNSGVNANQYTFWNGGNGKIGQWILVNINPKVVLNVTTTYSLTNNDFILLQSNTNASTVTLPLTPGWWRIKNVNTGVVTIVPPGSQTIDGYSAIELPLQGMSVDIVFDGNNFEIL